MTPHIVHFPDGILPTYSGGGYCGVLAVNDANGIVPAQVIPSGVSEMWTQEVNLRVDWADNVRLQNVMSHLRGGLNKLYCPNLYDMDKSYLGSYTGDSDIFTDGGRFTDGGGIGDPATVLPDFALSGAHSIGDTVVTVTMTPTNSFSIPTNKTIEIQERLYVARSWDSVNKQITIYPPLRDAATGGERVTIYEPKGMWRILDAESFTPNNTQRDVYDWNIKMIEDL